MPVSGIRWTVPGCTEPAEVERLGLHAVDPAGLVRGMGGRRQQPSRHQDENEPGDAEEAREVDANPAEVDGGSETDRRNQPDHRPRTGGSGIRGVLEGRQHEDCRFEALAEDCEERHPDEGSRRAGGERLRDVPSSCARRPRACRRIQTIM